MLMYHHHLMQVHHDDMVNRQEYELDFDVHSNENTYKQQKMIPI